MMDEVAPAVSWVARAGEPFAASAAAFGSIAWYVRRVSFDVFFYRGSTTQPSWDPLLAWADEKKHFARQTTPRGGFQLRYENPSTGVCFSIAQEEPPPPNPRTAHLAPAYLAFNLNFMRARFFAIEAAELVQDLAARLDLVAYDPQSGGVGRPTAAELVASWCRGNQHAVAAARSLGQQIPRMDVQRADAFWRYRYDFADVKRQLGEEVFVPQLVAVRWGEHALRLAILLKPAVYVMPPADLFFIERDGAPHIVRAEHVNAALGALCAPHHERPAVSFIGERRLFEPEVMKAWDSFYETVPVECPLSALEKLGPDAFVDV